MPDAQRIDDLVGYRAAIAKMHMKHLKGATSSQDRRLYLEAVERADGADMRRTLELEFGEWWMQRKVEGARNAGA